MFARNVTFFGLLLAGASLLSVVHAQTRIAVASPAASSPLNQVVQKLGQTPPSDAVLMGTVSITAGSTNEDGTVRIVTRDTSNTSETFISHTIARHVVSFHGIAAEQVAGTLKTATIGKMLSSRSALTPLTFLAAKLADQNRGKSQTNKDLK